MEQTLRDDLVQSLREAKAIASGEAPASHRFEVTPANVVADASDPIYNPVDLPRIKQSIEQGRRGEVVVKTLDDLEAMS
jgi:hypothetical protein